MALWHIVRTQGAGGTGVDIDCSDPTVPTLVTLRNQETGETVSTQMCWDPRAGHLCDNLDALAVTYTPNDWGVDCP